MKKLAKIFGSKIAYIITMMLGASVATHELYWSEWLYMSICVLAMVANSYINYPNHVKITIKTIFDYFIVVSERIFLLFLAGLRPNTIKEIITHEHARKTTLKRVFIGYFIIGFVFLVRFIINLIF